MQPIKPLKEMKENTEKALAYAESFAERKQTQYAGQYKANERKIKNLRLEKT